MCLDPHVDSLIRWGKQIVQVVQVKLCFDYYSRVTSEHEHLTTSESESTKYRSDTHKEILYVLILSTEDEKEKHGSLREVQSSEGECLLKVSVEWAKKTYLAALLTHLLKN